MAKSLITGCTGFIGNHLAERLLSDGDDVSAFVLDNERNVPYGVKEYRGNLSNFQDCLRIVGRSNPDTVYHLAAQPLIGTALRSPLDTFESNIRGAYNLLEAIRQVGSVSSVVWVSTDKVYGKQFVEVNEDSLLAGYEHPYDVSKLCGDYLARMYGKVYYLPTVIIRSGNIYGPWDSNWDRLIPGTIKSVLANESPVIRSDGTLKRDYIYIDDMINGYLLAKDYIENNSNFGDVLVFGSNSAYSVLEIVSIIIEKCHSNLSPIIQNVAKFEIPYQHVDSSKVLGLGWKRNTSLDEGLSKTIDWIYAL